MTIYDELLNPDVVKEVLVERLDKVLAVRQIEPLSKLFQAKLAPKKRELCKNLAEKIKKEVHPKIEEYRNTVTTEEFTKEAQKGSIYLYNLSVRPQIPQKEIPYIITLINNLGSAIPPTQAQETKPSLSDSLPMDDTYFQLGVLYFIDSLQDSKLTSLSDFKSYLVENGIMRIKEPMMVKVYSHLNHALSLQLDKVKYLYTLLPASPPASPRRPRSPSPRPRSPSPLPLNKEVEEDIPVVSIPVSRHENEEVEAGSVKEYVIRYLIHTYETMTKGPTEPACKTFVQELNPKIKNKDIKETYSSVMSHLKNTFSARQKDKKIDYLKGLIEHLSSETEEEIEDESEEESEEEIEAEEIKDIKNEIESVPQSPRVEIPALDFVEEKKIEYIETDNPQEDEEDEPNPPSAQGCNLESSHESIEALADDLSCPIGQACDVSEKTCIDIEKADHVETLLIGNRSIVIAGKDRDDIMNHIKEEVLSLTIKRKKQQATPIVSDKQYNSTPIDLDKLAQSLRSVQSSQLLYVQQKVKLADQDLRDKLRLCLLSPSVAIASQK